MRVSLILSVIADGTKLPPYIAFKGNNSAPKLTKEILNLPHIKNKEIFLLLMKILGEQKK